MIVLSSQLYPNQNVVMVCNFYDQMGNSLPQYQINTIVSYSDYNSILSMLSNTQTINTNQLNIMAQPTTSALIQSAQQVYSQIMNAENSIKFLAPNAGAGTTQGGTLNGVNILSQSQNIQFDAVFGSGGSSSGVILSPSDYVQLQTNAQANVSIQNATFTGIPPNTTYAALEQLIVNSGVNSLPSSGSAVLTNSGGVSNYMVNVSNQAGTVQSFIVSQPDYITLYTTQINSISYSQTTPNAVNATLSQVLTYITSGGTLSPLTGAVPITTPKQATTIIQNTVTQAITAAAQSGVINQQAASQAIQAVNTNTVDSNTAPVVQTSLNNAVQTGNMTSQAAVNNLNAVSQSTTVQNPLTPTLSNTNPISQNPFQIVVGLFAGALTFSFLAPKGAIGKALRSSKGKRKRK